MRLQSLLSEEDGQDLAEYGLIILLASIGVVAALQNVAAILVTLYRSIDSLFPALLPRP